MRTTRLASFVSFLLGAAVGAAGGQAPDSARRSARDSARLIDERLRDFDYLLGEWEFTSTGRDFGRGRGVWTAVRLAGGHVLDEYRVLGDTGQTYYHSATLRVYDAAADRWDLVSAERGAGLRNVGTGRRVGDEMHLEQRFHWDRPVILKIRYHDIRENSFSWVADRSEDGGRTWAEGYLRIEARRVGPARELPSLAPARVLPRHMDRR